MKLDVPLNYKAAWVNIQRGVRANYDNWSTSNIASENASLIDGLVTAAPNYTVAKIIIKGDGASNTHLTVRTFRPTVDLGGSVCNAKLIQLWANGDVKNDGAGLPEC